MTQDNNSKKTLKSTHKYPHLTAEHKAQLDKDLAGITRLIKKHGAEYLSRLVREDVEARTAAGARPVPAL